VEILPVADNINGTDPGSNVATVGAAQ